MTRNKMIEKYRDMLAGISNSNHFPDNGQNPDLGVALDMLIYEHNVRAGQIQRVDTYGGIPEDFDWDEFGKDYSELTRG